MQKTFKQLRRQLQLCLTRHRFAYGRRLERLQKAQRHGESVQDKLQTLAQQIERSMADREKRLASIPALSFPDLPISAKKSEIAALIEANQVLILCGETGSGKTTQLPKICLSLGLGAAGLIGHTQPRRVAARTVADRIAE